MFNRPRCRDWTALATQQLRLRNLIQISGHNIQCDGPNCSIYFTLHFTSMSAPFFTSEKLDARKTAIWPEINCPTIFKSTAHSVCIRVWQRKNVVSEGNDVADKDDGGASGGDNDGHTVDTVLFLWGVYFSGLVPISKRTDVKLKDNSLVFHIHGGFFTSAEYLLPECIPHQLDVFGLPDLHQLIVDQSCDQIGLSRKGSNNLHLIADIRKSNTRSKEEGDDEEEDIEQSAGDADKTLCMPEHQLLKVRFTEKNFFKSEIRPSYDVAKLLRLQEKQRQFRKKNESAREVMDKICMKSAFCLNLELIANKKFLLRPRGNPSMGRTLNRLLFQQPEQPKPEVLLKAQAIRRQIETAKFRCRLLLQEKNQALMNIRKLETKLGTLSDSNIEQEAWLMANYRELGKNREYLMEFTSGCLRQKELNDRLYLTLCQRKQQILRELKEIYCIKRTESGCYTINGAALPTAEVYAESITPSDISVALGYAAHVTLMCSIILDCPLRNTIVHKGSASIINDTTKVIPDSNREFPLFCRHNPPPEPLLYAVYLLNQNISQLKYFLGHNKDMRAVLPNLLQLLNGSSTSLMSQDISLRCSSSLLDVVPKSSNLGSSSIDLNVHHVLPPVNGLFSSIGHNRENRVCRSVECYPNETISKAKSNFTSEPVLCTKTMPAANNFRSTDNGNI